MAKGEAQSASTKSSKAANTGSAAAKTGGTEGTGDKGAPRPRKFDYGIKNENKVTAVKRTKDEGEPKLKAQEAEGYAVAQKGCTVEAFMEASSRAILRRLSRKGLITITAPDGTKYPRPYEAPVADAKADKAA